MIRQALLSDVPLISEIHAESWQRAYRGIVPDDYLDCLTGTQWQGPLTQWLKSGTLTICLLEMEHGPIGCVSFGPGREEGRSDWGEIVSLYLFPAYFDSGKGGLLLKHALQELKQQGYRSVYLWVLAENDRARRFYEKHGLRASGDTLEIEIAAKTLHEVRYEIQL